MSPKAMLSVGVFALLLILVFATRQENARSGIRELALPSLKGADLVELTVSGKYQAHLRHADDTWTVASPDKVEQRFPVDTASVERLLEAVETLEPGAFVTSRKEKHADLEVDEEKGTVVSLVTKDGKNLELVFGRAAKGGGNYLRMKRADEVFVGKGNLAAQLRKNTDQWRNKKIVDVLAGAVARLEVQGPTASFVIERQKGDGEGAVDTYRLADTVPAPAGFKADSDSLSRVVRSFAGLSAVDFVDEQKPESETGLAKGAKLVATLDDSKNVEVHLGSLTDDKKVYASRAGDPQLYLVTEYARNSLLKSLDELRDLSLFAGLDEAQVKALRFTSPDGDFLVERSGDTWTFKGPRGADTFDPGAVAAKVTGLARLKGARFIAEPGQQKAPLGKDPLTVAVTLDDGSVRTLRVGEPVLEDDGKPSHLVYAVTDDGTVYGLSRSQKDRYKKADEVFKRVEAHQGMPGMGGMPGGGIQGLEGLPPEIRKQLEQQLRQQGLGR